MRVRVCVCVCVCVCACVCARETGSERGVVGKEIVTPQIACARARAKERD